MAKKRTVKKRKAAPRKKSAVKKRKAAPRKKRAVKKRKAAPRKKSAVKKRKAAPRKKRKSTAVGKRKRKYYTSVKVNPAYTAGVKKKKRKKSTRSRSIGSVSLKTGGAFSAAHRMIVR